jgi:hypothetical protein
MEAFNGTVRSREKVMRSLKREDSPILDGYRIFHNHVRPHTALDDKTPAELCGIEVKVGFEREEVAEKSRNRITVVGRRMEYRGKQRRAYRQGSGC